MTRLSSTDTSTIVPKCYDRSMTAQPEVTKVMAYCRCGHEASIDVSAMLDDVFVPAIKDRLRCTLCGERPMNQTRLAAVSAAGHRLEL